MTQYVIQIQVAENGKNIGWLAKSFKVTAEAPIPTNVPTGRIQVIMTNTNSFNGIAAVYDQYTTTAIFVKNGTNIDVSGPVTDSWPID